MTKELIIDEERRIRLPEEALQTLQAKPGDSIRLRTLDKGEVVLEHTIDIMELYCSVDAKGIHATIEEMEKAIGEAVKEEWFRSTQTS